MRFNRSLLSANKRRYERTRVSVKHGEIANGGKGAYGVTCS